MGVLVLAIALIVWGVVGRGTPAPVEEPTPVPSDTTPLDQRTWVPQIKVLNYDMLDVGLDTIAVVVNYDDVVTRKVTVHGMDLRTGTEVWSQSGTGHNVIGDGDSNGFALELDSKLMVLDLFTGKITAQVSLSQYQHLLWAGNGLILTEDAVKGVLCVATMRFPGRCVWKAPNISGSLGNCPGSSANGYLFADWLNTGKGVRDLVTGKPAGFGRDAGYKEATYKDGGNMDYVTTYYCGLPGRVYKVRNSGNWSASVTSYQLWDTDTDSAISPPLDDPIYWIDPASPVFAVYHQGSAPLDRSTVTAYNWQTGEQLWRVPVNLSRLNNNDQLIDGYWITDTDRTITAYDIMTGRIVWHSLAAKQIVGIKDGLLYAYNASQAIALDPANGFNLVRIPKGPQDNLYGVAFTEHLVYYVDMDRMLWVLQ